MRDCRAHVRSSARAILLCLLGFTALSQAETAPAGSLSPFWLLLDPSPVAPGQPVTLRLQRGTDAAPIGPAQFERFQLLQGTHVADLTTADSTADVPLPAFDVAGPCLVVLTRNSRTETLTPAAFEAYVAAAQPGGVTPAEMSVSRDQRLRHWEFAKALGQVGDDTEGSLHHRVIGQQLELVMLQNPALLAPGEEQIVQAYFDSRPLVGQRVIAESLAAGAPATRYVLETDARGVVRLPLPAAGPWRLTTARLQRCKGCTDADWDSYAASYSFVVPVAARP